jgi:hypothetical protein
MTPDGTVLESVDDDLADAAAYATRLAEIIGDLLDTGGFRVLDLAATEKRIVVFGERDGNLVAALLPPGMQIRALRGRIGL